MPKKHSSKKSSHPDLTLIFLTYNTQFWIKKALTTLKEQVLDHSKYSIKTVVVDNDSNDDTLEMLKNEFKWVEVIAMGENGGFAVGNNKALEQVTSRYAMLLNSDLEFTQYSDLDRLIEEMDSHPEYGVISPRLELVSGEIDPACHRGEPTIWASATYFSGLAKLFPGSAWLAQYHQTFKDQYTPHPIDAVSGAAMLVRMDVVEKIGLLDEQFFMYAEDLDWCRRFRQAGYIVQYFPTVKITHHKYKSGIKSSSKKIATQTNKYFYDTMLQYYDKYYQDSYPKFVRTLLRYFVAIKKEGF